MILFIAGHGVQALDVSAPRRALTDLIQELGFFDAASVETWRSPSGQVAIAAVSHAGLETAGIRYTSFQPDRAALFAGRPVWWPKGRPPDGQAPLDPGFYHAPAEQWAGGLEGRCTALRAEDRRLQVFVDPVGAYPVFVTRALAGTRWFSNSADTLRRLAGDGSIDETALAGILGGGWSLGGQPLWRAVRRLPRGVLLSIAPDGAEHERDDLLPLERIARLPGAGLDPARAGAELVELTAALARWPGRPDVVPVTGGRDSRLILAAALQGGFPFEALTGGAAGDPDVEVARRLCGIAGEPHALLAADPHGDRFSDVARAARVTALASGGTATLADAAGFPLGPRSGPLPVWHSGQGGEIARAYYGLGGPGGDRELYQRFVGRRPGRTEIVSPEAGRVLAGEITAFSDRMQAAGAAAVDIPDLFYLLERMACWAAPAHGVVELIRDTTSPLWSAGLLEHLLGLPARERALERFHLLVLEQIGPELVDVPFQDGSGWPSRQSAAGRRVARARVMAGKVRRELARRAAARRPITVAESPATPSAPPPDPFDAILSAAREATSAQPQHAAWAVLDRARVERLLASPASALDEMSRYYVWRLISVFLGLQ